MDPRTDRLIRRTAMVAACTGAYFLLTADYGPDDSVLLPVRGAMKSMEQSVKKFLSGSDKESRRDPGGETPRVE